jgi:glycosyltransferase involved in cell wall biosynthesis
VIVMRLFFISRTLGSAGAERQLVNLARGLNQNGHDVVVGVFYPWLTLEGDLRQSGIRVIPLLKQGRWDVFTPLRKMISIVNREATDIVLGYLTGPNMLATLLKPFFPKLKIIWGMRDSGVDIMKSDFISNAISRAESYESRFADLIIANSFAGEKYCVAKGFPADKIVTIPNGIDIELFEPDQDARLRIRSEWRIRDDEVLIGLAARYHLMKDHPTFLKAAKSLSERIGNVRFAIVGEGPESYRKELLILSKSLGLGRRLIWCGARRDMPAVQNAFDIATLSSAFGEGFPNVIGEAMACGVPCVVTDVGDSKWIVGDTGIVVSPGDPLALACAWSTMIEKVRESKPLLAERARRRIIEHFGVDTLVRKTEEVLADLV